MFNSLLKALGAGLSIWEHKEKRKYIDRIVAIKTAYNAEYNKPIGERSDDELDKLKFELRVLAEAFAADVAGGSGADK